MRRVKHTSAPGGARSTAQKSSPTGHNSPVKISQLTGLTLHEIRTAFHCPEPAHPPVAYSTASSIYSNDDDDDDDIATPPPGIQPASSPCA